MVLQGSGNTELVDEMVQNLDAGRQEDTFHKMINDLETMDIASRTMPSIKENLENPNQQQNKV